MPDIYDSTLDTIRSLKQTLENMRSVIIKRRQTQTKIGAQVIETSAEVKTKCVDEYCRLRSQLIEDFKNLPDMGVK